MTRINFKSDYQKAEIKEKLELLSLEIEKISDYVNLEVFSFAELSEAQTGYSIDSNGNSLVTGEEGGWDDNWLVIGYETLCGDPIIIELNRSGYPVSLLMHGMDNWISSSTLADSIDSFIDILKHIGSFLSEKDVLEGKQYLQMKGIDVKKIILNNKYADFERWESLLSPLLNLAEEHERALKEKVMNLKKEGKKLSEIACLLNMSNRDVYGYLKK